LTQLKMWLNNGLMYEQLTWLISTN